MPAVTADDVTIELRPGCLRVLGPRAQRRSPRVPGPRVGVRRLRARVRPSRRLRRGRRGVAGQRPAGHPGPAGRADVGSRSTRPRPADPAGRSRRVHPESAGTSPRRPTGRQPGASDDHHHGDLQTAAVEGVGERTGPAGGRPGGDAAPGHAGLRRPAGRGCVRRPPARPRRPPRPPRRLPLRHRHPGRAARWSAAGLTPGRPDGTAAFAGILAKTYLVHEPRAGHVGRLPGHGRGPIHLRPGGGGRHQHPPPRQPQPAGGAVREPGRHGQQLRRRADPVGHVAHVRGDRGQGRRRPDQGPRLGLRGQPVVPDRQPDPEPLTALGRFAHEAVTIDPLRGHVYLTEDASSPNGLLYRFTPDAWPGRIHSLRDGGTLEAMRVAGRGRPVRRSRRWARPCR